MVKILRETLADLRELEAPEGDEDTVAKIIASLEDAGAAREDQFAAARANDGPAESKAKSTFITASQDLGASAGAFGMTHCQSLGF
jgi:pyruvate/2-oxoglutarate dehydrogenase complex dihydrolipoamide acyltransferase (E2) component